jgi:hypothetical protein
VHARKEIRQVIRYALDQGWTLDEVHHGHVFGWLECGHGCRIRIFSTPRNPSGAAKATRREISNCPHR